MLTKFAVTLSVAKLALSLDVPEAAVVSVIHITHVVLTNPSFNTVRRPILVRCTRREWDVPQ